MKYTLLFLPILACAGNAHAQKDSLSNRNEIGLFAETSLSSSQSVSSAGIKYTRWHSSNLGFKFMAGYGSYTNYPSNSFYTQAGNDTLIQHANHEHAGLMLVGVGFEEQRHFFKRVYLSAGIDLKAGYGAGRVDTNVNSYSLFNNNQLNDYYKSETVTGSTLSIFMVSLCPYIAAKTVYKHITVGIQSALQLNNYNIKYAGKPSGSTTNFDIGNIANQVFIQYRF